MENLPDLAILNIAKFLDHKSMNYLSRYFVSNFLFFKPFYFSTSTRMEAILSVKVMRKGEEVSQFEKEEGVNMDGQTKKKYKEKEGLKSMIRYMRQRLFMN